MLEVLASQEIPAVRTMDGTFEAARVQGSREAAAFIINRVTRKAKEFVQTPVEGTEAPIVVPE